MEACGLFDTNDNELRPVRQATEDDAVLFHSRNYIDFLRERSRIGTGYLDRFDTPAFPGCLDAALWLAGSTMAAMQEVLEHNAHAFSVGGGLHHGHRDRASGFCILNDIAIALCHARKSYGLNKAAYIDIDVHHGDGIFYGFYGEDWLLNLDVHQDGYTLFPGTGFVLETGGGAAAGLKLNLPLPPRACDDSALAFWREVAEPAIRSFEPELIVIQCGADAHYNDPLAHIRWSTTPYFETARSVHELAHDLCDGRLLMVGGGGYNPCNACLCWAGMALTAGKLDVPDEIPPEWRGQFEKAYGYEAPARFAEDMTSSPQRFAITQQHIEELRGLSPLLRGERG